ncbi:hypothetical protein TWF281_005659 [Arthrobotrys megalospora]
MDFLWSAGKLPPPASWADHDRKRAVNDTIARVFQLMNAWGGDKSPPPSPPTLVPQPIISPSPPASRRKLPPLTDQQMANLVSALKISPTATPDLPQTEEEVRKEFEDNLKQFGLDPEEFLPK